MVAHLLHAAYCTLNSHFPFHEVQCGNLTSSQMVQYLNEGLPLPKIKITKKSWPYNEHRHIYWCVHRCRFLTSCMHGLLYNSVTVKYCSALFHTVQVSLFFFFPPSISKNKLPCCWAGQHSYNLAYTAWFV